MRTLALRLAPAAALAALLSAPLHAAAIVRSTAQIVSPNPDPGITGEGYVNYAGHYGEVFKLRGGWKIDPFMRDGIEVINLYPKFRRDLPEGIYEPFRPKPSDFEPEKFTPLALIQLLIIPRSSEGFQSLADLKEAKLRDLKASGVRFRLYDHPHFPAFRGDWPAGSFEIVVDAPYRLTQLYTATSSHTCILTAGLDTPPSTYIDRHYGGLRSGLAKWVVPQERPVPDDRSSAIRARGLTFHPFTVPIIWVSWAVVTGLACLVIGALKLTDRGGALRRVAVSVLVFSHAGALLGGLLGFAFWPFAWFSHHAPIPGSIACLFMPLIAVLMTRLRGVGLPRRALIGVSLAAIAAAGFLAYCGSYDWGGGDRTRYLFAYSVILGYIFYTIGGVIFGVLDSPDRAIADKGPLAVLAALFLASSAHSQAVSGQSIDSKARLSLAQKGVTEAGFRDKATENLSETRVIYTHHRVEIRGILSKKSGDNDTNAKFGPLFDLQIAPTHLDKVQGMPGWMEVSRAVIDDLISLNRDAYNQLSSAAEEAVEELDDKEVDEIVAHSWGTEIVYNAILAGKIRPPRRLIVAGMPDRDLDKWKALSNFTGTEVIVYYDPTDPIAGAARLGGDVIDGLSRGGEVQAGEIAPHMLKDPNRFDLQWKTACAERAGGCNPHRRYPKSTEIVEDYRGKTHNRFEYYSAMQERLDLPSARFDQRADPNSKPYFPGSAPALKEAQEALIDREAHRLYVGALTQERVRIAREEAAHSGGEAAFLQDVQKVGAISDEAKAAFKIQEDAAREALKSDPEYIAYVAKVKEWRREFNEEQERNSRRLDAEFLLKQEHWADMKNRWAYLRDMTGLACSDPDALERLGREGKAPGVSLVDLDLKWEMSRIETVSMKDRPVANACQKFILTAIMGSTSLVSGSEMLELARRYRSQHPGIAARFANGLGNFFTSLGNIITSAGDVVGNMFPSGAQSSGEQRGTSGPPGPERADCFDTYIPELNQTIHACPR